MIGNIVLDTVEGFDDLHLNELDEDWVNEIIMNDFSCDIETEVFPVDSIDTLNSVLNICRKWVKSSEQLCVKPDDSYECEQEEVLWKVLMENDINIKSFLALIYLFCTRSLKESVTFPDKLLGLTSAKLYLTLLVIPGSNAYSIFHPALLKLAVNCLKFPNEKPISKKRPPHSAHRIEVAHQRKRVHRVNSDMSVESEDVNEDSVENDEISYNQQELHEMFVHFCELLVDLIKFLDSSSLKSDDETLEHVISKLVECSTCDIQHSQFDFDKNADVLFKTRRHSNISHTLASLAFKGLLSICTPLHGPEETNYLRVLKCLCNLILCVRAGQNIAQKFIAIRDNAVSFVCYNLRKFPTYSLRCTRTLIQQLCLRVNEKADFRLKVARAIAVILNHFPNKEFAEMIEWFTRYVKQMKIQDRLTALEVFNCLLSEPQRENAEELSDDLALYITMIPIVDEIIDRCNDRASTVRTKAMNVLATNLEGILGVINSNHHNQFKQTESDSEFSSSSSLSVDSDVETDKDHNNPEDHRHAERLDRIAKLICHHTRDTKVYARKAALQGLQNLICLNKIYLTTENLELFLEAATDPNIMMKKACISSISDILNKYKGSLKVQSFWLRTVLPLLLDPEKSIQSKSLEVMEVQFLVNVSGSESEKRCSWSLLNQIASGEHSKLQRFVSKAFFYWKAEGKLKPNIRTVLEHEIGSENNEVTWLLLHFLSTSVEIKNTAFIVKYWEEECCHQNMNTSIMTNVYQVIGNTCKHINSEKLKDIQTKLESDIREFSCPVELIAIAIETLFKLYDVQSSRTDSYQRIRSSFASDVMVSTEKFLSSLILEKQSTIAQYQEDLICRHLMTLGDLALLSPLSIPKKIFFIIQSMIASPFVEDDRCSTTSGQSSQSNQAERNLPPKIQAVTFITLGKLCLQSEELTKKCVPALACELVNSKHCVIRNNIIVVLADLCMRYTSVVDLYVPRISACLKDSNFLVREQTLIMLSKLLQEDYIKWKDSLMFRMLSMVIDENKDIRSVAKYFFGHMMVKRNPAVFYQNFIECVYFFNGYSDSRKKFAHFDQDTKLFILKGDHLRKKRMALYKFMIKNTVAPKKFALSIKLCQDVLGAVADNVIPLDDDGKAILKDCLHVLSTEEIKLPSLHGGNTDENDETEVAEVIVVKAAQRVSLVQIVIPIVISLKKFLESVMSPLSTDLMLLLREIMKDYKTELKDLFAQDKQMATEIEFDIRRFEKEMENKDTHVEVVAVPSATPARLSIVNNQNAVMMSVEKAKRISKRMSTGARLSDVVEDAESAYQSNDAIPSTSSIMQPVVVIEKLSFNDAGDTSAIHHVRAENDEHTASQSSLRSNISLVNTPQPIVVLNRLSKDVILKATHIESSTPINAAAPVQSIELDISDITESDTQSSRTKVTAATVQKSQRTTRKFKRKK